MKENMNEKTVLHYSVHCYSNNIYSCYICSCYCNFLLCIAMYYLIPIVFCLHHCSRIYSCLCLAWTIPIPFISFLQTTMFFACMFLSVSLVRHASQLRVHYTYSCLSLCLIPLPLCLIPHSLCLIPLSVSHSYFSVSHSSFSVSHLSLSVSHASFSVSYSFLCVSSLSLCLIPFSVSHYASPTSGEAYRDRRLTTNFEL